MTITIVFAITFFVIVGIFVASQISTRIYNKEDIISEIENNKGTQFDPKIADIFLKLINNGKV